MDFIHIRIWRAPDALVHFTRRWVLLLISVTTDEPQVYRTRGAYDGYLLCTPSVINSRVKRTIYCHLMRGRDTRLDDNILCGGAAVRTGKDVLRSLCYRRLRRGCFEYINMFIIINVFISKGLFKNVGPSQHCSVQNRVTRS